MARHDFRKHPVDVTFRVPTKDDIAYVAANMREADRREVKRMSGCDHGWCLRESVGASVVCYAATVNGRICGITGVTNVNFIDGTAVLWMLSTNDVFRSPRDFAVASLLTIDKICKELPQIAEFDNWVDVEYGAAVRWVEWFGGSFGGKERIGRCGGRFRRFTILNPYYTEE